MKINNKILYLFLLLLMSVSVLSGCQSLSSFGLGVKEVVNGLEGTIQTYDEDSQVIDNVYGKSISFSANSEFVKVDSEGNTSGGSVLDITVGGKSIIHVGSTLLFYEKGLDNVYDEYSKVVDIENLNRSVPFLNRMVNDMVESFKGHNRLILVRSQSGKPLATFAGEKVSVESTGVEKMTKITIDGKRMYIYRADYTIYDLDLLNN